MLALLAATVIPTAIPTVIGVAEGVSQQKSENAKAAALTKGHDEATLMRKFGLSCWCEGASATRDDKRGKKRRRVEDEVHGGGVGLRGGKVSAQNREFFWILLRYLGRMEDGNGEGRWVLL